MTILKGPYRVRQNFANAPRRWDAANRTSTGFVSDCIVAVEVKGLMPASSLKAPMLSKHVPGI